MCMHFFCPWPLFWGTNREHRTNRQVEVWFTNLLVNQPYFKLGCRKSYWVLCTTRRNTRWHKRKFRWITPPAQHFWQPHPIVTIAHFDSTLREISHFFFPWGLGCIGYDSTERANTHLNCPFRGLQKLAFNSLSHLFSTTKLCISEFLLCCNCEKALGKATSFVVLLVDICPSFDSIMGRCVTTGALYVKHSSLFGETCTCFASR